MVDKVSEIITGSRGMGINRLSNNAPIPLKVLPLDGGGLPAFGGAEGDRVFGWG
jgi:hypothetical protein